MRPPGPRAVTRAENESTEDYKGIDRSSIPPIPSRIPRQASGTDGWFAVSATDGTRSSRALPGSLCSASFWIASLATWQAVKNAQVRCESRILRIREGRQRDLTAKAEPNRCPSPDRQTNSACVTLRETPEANQTKKSAEGRRCISSSTSIFDSFMICKSASYNDCPGPTHRS